MINVDHFKLCQQLTYSYISYCGNMA